MKKCIYTVLVNDYDFIFPPVVKELDVDYILFADSKNLKISGWEIKYINNKLIKKFSPSKLNRYYKMLPHLFLSDYDISIYIDANIKIIGKINTLFDEFLNSQCEIGLLRHPHRNNVKQEISACIRLNKAISNAAIIDEYYRYIDDGFLDKLQLTENNVIIRLHNNKTVTTAMEFWWSCFQTSAGRDQISLPFVRQKSNLKEIIYQFNARIDNPYFKIYSHKTNNFLKNLGILLYVKGFTSFYFKILSKFYNLGLRCMFLLFRFAKNYTL